MNLQLYDSKVRCRTISMISGDHAEELAHTELPDMPVIQAFLDDDDLQELRICSTNIGFVRTFSKLFRPKPKPPLGERSVK